jgi:hypothetical protein
MDIPQPNRTDLIPDKMTTIQKITFQKTMTVYVAQEYTFDEFKKSGIKKNQIETDTEFNKRCIDVWNTMCEDADKYGNIDVPDGEICDEEDYFNCEDDIERKIEDAVEFIDEEMKHCDECYCGDVAGTYGEHSERLCEDCRDEKGFCSCGEIKEECMTCCEDD